MSSLSKPMSEVREVWAENLYEEFARIRQLIEKYSYVAIDTEFPGVVLRPEGNFANKMQEQYQRMRINVDCMNIIQIGLCFSTPDGHYPTDGPFVYQFNFKYSLSTEQYAKDSIDLLQKSGIKFTELEQHGIDISDFAELLTTSGLVLSSDVRYVSFHSAHDFAYMIKLLTRKPLPSEERSFYDLLHKYFPAVYDVKYIVKDIDKLKGGLEDLSKTLGVQRVGTQHQAGSDALLTMNAFFRARADYFNNTLNDDAVLGVLFASKVLPPSSNLKESSLDPSASPYSGLVSKSYSPMPQPPPYGVGVMNMNAQPWPPERGMQMPSNSVIKLF